MQPVSFSQVIHRVFISWSPIWVAVCGAICLLLACWFPWMLFLNDPIVPTTRGLNGAGGPLQEPLWFGLSLVVSILSLFKVPYRRLAMTIMTGGFCMKLWFVYQALTAWFHLNTIQAQDSHAQYAPFATYGPGWYFLMLGCALLSAYLIVSQWLALNHS